MDQVSEFKKAMNLNMLILNDINSRDNICIANLDVSNMVNMDLSKFVEITNHFRKTVLKCTQKYPDILYDNHFGTRINLYSGIFENKEDYENMLECLSDIHDGIDEYLKIYGLKLKILIGSGRILWMKIHGSMNWIVSQKIDRYNLPIKKNHQVFGWCLEDKSMSGYRFEKVNNSRLWEIKVCSNLLIDVT